MPGISIRNVVSGSRRTYKITARKGVISGNIGNVGFNCVCDIFLQVVNNKATLLDSFNNRGKVVI